MVSAPSSVVRTQGSLVSGGGVVSTVSISSCWVQPISPATEKAAQVLITAAARSTLNRLSLLPSMLRILNSNRRARRSSCREYARSP